jgi:hypothetical protein
MTDDELDRRSRAEAARISAEAAAIADTDDALDALLHPAAPVRPNARRRPRILLIGAISGGVAAAIAVVVGVAVVVQRDDDGRRVREPTAVVSTPPAPTTAGPPTSPAAASTSTLGHAPTTTAASTTSSPLDPTAIDRLADWPPAPYALPTLADVPLLLPTDAIPVAARVERSEWAASEPPVWSTFQQEWALPGSQPLVLTITTKPFLSLDGLQNSTRVSLAGWDEAYVQRAGGGRESVVLREPSGSVTVSGLGLTQDEVQLIATTLRRRADGPGWLPDFAGTRLVDPLALAEGWANAGAGTTVQWLDGNVFLAELTVDAGGQWGTGVVGFGGEPLQFVDVSGATAVLTAAGSVRISWSPAAGVSARVGYAGSVEDALRFVRSLRPVDRATWEAASGPSTYTSDGCNSMFC